MHDYDKLHAEFHQRLLADFLNNLKQSVPFNQQELSEDDQSFFDVLLSLPQLTGEQFLNIGQQCLCRIVSTYSHLMPIVPRDLFWFFGGDCLHYMPDDEIAKFQQLEDLRYEAAQNNESVNYEELRARALGLH